MARLDDLRTELRDTRTELAAARKAASVSVDGHSMTRQRIGELEKREQALASAVARLLRGSPLRCTGVNFTR